jgi:alpha/beta superfamily hydrolase
LRFNSRGVGKSTGWSSFTGTNEGIDLHALVQWGLDNIPDVRSVVIVVRVQVLSYSARIMIAIRQGYSHGSLIASLQPVLPPPIKTSHILLSYPLSTRGLITLFHTSKYTSALTELIHNPSSNTLIIFGTRDDFTGEGAYDGWVQTLQKEADGEGKGSLQFAKVDGATHFWTGEYGRQLQRLIEAWLS